MTTSLADLPCACATARQLARLLTQLYDGRLRASGLEVPQFALLTTLELGPSSPADLVRGLALDKTTVSRNLTLLQRKGWIEISVGKDRRRRELKLTSAGRERLAAAKPEWKKAQQELRARMPGGQWDAMFRMFRSVGQAAQKMQP